VGRNNEFHFGKQGHKINISYTADGDRWDDAMEAAEDTIPKSPNLIKLYSDMPLVTGQDTADKTTLNSYKKASSKDAPTVFTHKGQMWIHDGHHRISASRMNGEEYIIAKHWNTGE
jgi:hypothetical protein